MNCANHVDVPATAYCRTCGKPLCSACTRDVQGVIYCEECLASHLGSGTPPPGQAVVPPAVEPLPNAPSPTLAAILGIIPGVGAMYNGEYAKGFVHVLILATLIWMTDHVSGIFGLAIAGFVIYMPFEAYKTAKAHEMGLPSPDPFGFNTLFSMGSSPRRAAGTAAAVAPMDAGGVPSSAAVDAEPRSRAPIGAFILIGLGVLFLLGEIGPLHLDWILQRFWPLILIAIGVRILMVRQRRGR